MVVDQILVDVAEQMGQFGRIDATDRNGVAVPPAEVFEFFDGMAKRMSVVEEFTQSGFFEVGGHMVRLHRHGTFDEFGDHILQIGVKERRTVERAQLVGMVFKHAQNLRMKPDFATSPRPSMKMSFGNEASAPMSASTPAGV